jgi:integrase
MILLAYRHGLRASELLDLRWEQVDLDHALLHGRRVKAGTPSPMRRRCTVRARVSLPGKTHPRASYGAEELSIYRGCNFRRDGPLN